MVIESRRTLLPTLCRRPFTNLPINNNQNQVPRRCRCRHHSHRANGSRRLRPMVVVVVMMALPLLPMAISQPLPVVVVETHLLRMATNPANLHPTVVVEMEEEPLPPMATTSRVNLHPMVVEAALLPTAVNPHPTAAAAVMGLLR